MTPIPNPVASDSLSPERPRIQLLVAVAALGAAVAAGASRPARAAGSAATAPGASPGGAEVAPFRRLEVSLPAEVSYSVGNTSRVTVEAEARARAGIAVRSSQGLLRIETRGSWSTDQPVRVRIEGPADLEMASVDSTSRLTLAGLRNGAFRLTVGESAEVTLERGRWDRLEATLDGSSRARAVGDVGQARIAATDSSRWDGSRLQAADVEVETGDSARALVRASDRIAAHASGASSIVTTGTATVTRSVDDAATIDGHGAAAP